MESHKVLPPSTPPLPQTPAAKQAQADIAQGCYGRSPLGEYTLPAPARIPHVQLEVNAKTKTHCVRLSARATAVKETIGERMPANLRVNDARAAVRAKVSGEQRKQRNCLNEVASEARLHAAWTTIHTGQRYGALRTRGGVR